MHVILGMRGHKPKMDEYITDLCTRYVPYKVWDEKQKKIIEHYFSLRVSPIMLYDISFPEHMSDAVLATIFGKDKGKSTAPGSKILNKLTWPVRKLLKLDPLPPYKDDDVLVMRPPEHLDIIALGVKKDKWYNAENGKIYDTFADVPEDEKDKVYEGI